MRRLFALPVRCLALAGVLTACGGDDDGASASPAALFEERDSQIDTICGCYDELGWESRSECINGQDPILSSKRKCAEDALSEDADASDEYLSCYMPLERDFTACVDDRLKCNDVASIEACIDDYNVGKRECIELPPAVNRELENCGVELKTLSVKTGTAGGGNEPGGDGCSDTCEFADDGTCDDGGAGAEFEACELGTDCTDCGPR